MSVAARLSRLEARVRTSPDARFMLGVRQAEEIAAAWDDETDQPKVLAEALRASRAAFVAAGGEGWVWETLNLAALAERRVSDWSDAGALAAAVEGLHRELIAALTTGTVDALAASWWPEQPERVPPVHRHDRGAEPEPAAEREPAGLRLLRGMGIRS
jgi:hypothetical protein